MNDDPDSDDDDDDEDQGRRQDLREMAETQKTVVREKSLPIRNLLVSILAFAAGFTDALSLLAFGGVFASVMTGNTVLLGLAIGRGDPLSAIRSAIAIAGYMIGVAAGTVASSTTHPPLKEVWPHRATRAFSLELIVMLTLAVSSTLIGGLPNHSYSLSLLVALASMSMGIQSAGVSAVGVSGISTTYITGTYTNFVINLIHWRRSSNTPERALKKRSDATLQAVVVVVYVLAAISGGLAATRLSFAAALVPPIALATVVVIARTRMA